MQINDFFIKSLNTQIRSRYNNFFGANIIDLSDYSFARNSEYIGIVSLNIRGMKMFFEFDLFENQDIFKQFCTHIEHRFEKKFSYPPKSKPNTTILREQIIDCLLFNTGKSIGDYDYDIFGVLASEALYNNCHLDDSMNYINNQFEPGGNWHPLIDGVKKIKIKTSFGD